MRRRRITRKPTKGESIFGGIVCFAMGCFGLFALVKRRDILSDL